MDQLIKEQILKVRAAGETNMFDVNMVSLIAFREGFHDLVIYLKDHKSAYIHFILTGEVSAKEVES